MNIFLKWFKGDNVLQLTVLYLYMLMVDDGNMQCVCDCIIFARSCVCDWNVLTI